MLHASRSENVAVPGRGRVGGRARVGLVPRHVSPRPARRLITETATHPILRSLLGSSRLPASGVAIHGRVRGRLLLRPFTSP
jgi:hypothetical protein